MSEIPNCPIPDAIRESICTSLTPSEQDALLGPYCYFRAKAMIYLRKGPEAYRQDDFFHCPRKTWNADQLAALENGFRQIIGWRGLSAIAPLEGLGMEELYLLMEVAHFQFHEMACMTADDDTRLVTVRLRHRVDGRTFPLIYRFHSEPAASFSLAPGSVAETWGYTADNPILCHDPIGEVLFINSLRCPNGHPFRGHRTGSLDGQCTSPATHFPVLNTHTDDSHCCIVDRYELKCIGGEHTCSIYFDMYHPGIVPQLPPSGLQLVPEP